MRPILYWDAQGRPLGDDIRPHRRLPPLGPLHEVAGVTSGGVMAQRETVAYEVVVRFYPGAEKEACELARLIGVPEQARWTRVDRITVPEGEAREQTLVIGRSGA